MDERDYHAFGEGIMSLGLQGMGHDHDRNLPIWPRLQGMVHDHDRNSPIFGPQIAQLQGMGHDHDRNSPIRPQIDIELVQPTEDVAQLQGMGHDHGRNSPIRPQIDIELVQPTEDVAQLQGMGHDHYRNSPIRPPLDQELVQPTEDVESERKKRFQYLNMCLPLYRAGLKGDWQAAKAILDKYPDAVRVPITQDKENILHIATLAKHSTFVQELLKLMRPEDLELKNKEGKTASYCAALSGVVKIAEKMVEKNYKLPLIRVDGENLPLHVATLLQNRDMVSYLFSATPFGFLTATDRIHLLLNIILADFYGMHVVPLTNLILQYSSSCVDSNFFLMGET